jgi:hypothetical protein
MRDERPGQAEAEGGARAGLPARAPWKRQFPDWAACAPRPLAQRPARAAALRHRSPSLNLHDPIASPMSLSPLVEETTSTGPLPLSLPAILRNPKPAIPAHLHQPQRAHHHHGQRPGLSLGKPPKRVEGRRARNRRENGPSRAHLAFGSGSRALTRDALLLESRRPRFQPARLPSDAVRDCDALLAQHQADVPVASACPSAAPDPTGSVAAAADVRSTQRRGRPLQHVTHGRPPPASIQGRTGRGARQARRG